MSELIDYIKLTIIGALVLIGGGAFVAMLLG